MFFFFRWIVILLQYKSLQNCMATPCQERTVIDAYNAEIRNGSTVGIESIAPNYIFTS